MKKVYRSALGKAIDMDNLRLANEETIAIGNMKVNARGDELGPGGQVLRTRNQVMDDYYRLNTPMATDSAPVADNAPAPTPVIMPEAVDAAQPVSPAEAAKLKGNLASTFAKK
jgi:hypothetical protein